MNFLSLFLITLAFSNSLAAEVQVKVTLSPAGSFIARTDKVAGAATQKGEKFQASQVVVDLKELKTGIALRDKHMREKYLETDKYPTATLLSAEGENGKGKGQIKIRDITKDILGTYKVLSGDKAEARFPLKISDFIKKEVSYMGVGVEDDIEIIVTLPIKKGAL